MNISREQVDKLIVGTNDVSYVEPDISPTGTAVLNGPVYIGKPTASPSYEAFLNVSSNAAEQSPIDRQAKAEASLAIKADGNVVIDGDDKTTQALFVNGKIVTTDTIDTNGSQINVGFVNGSGASPAVKAFDIEHPSKSGYRLRHICLEGPESAIYYRGRLKGSNIIKLPHYWKDLVHEDSITVQLQPIGKNQNLVIESFNSSYVVIELGANQDFLTNEILIDCFYHVYAERKDVEKLIPEYEGTDMSDYPGDNSIYSINK